MLPHQEQEMRAGGQSKQRGCGELSVPIHPGILCRLAFIQSPASETAPDLDPRNTVIEQPV